MDHIMGPHICMALDACHASSLCGEGMSSGMVVQVDGGHENILHTEASTMKDLKQKQFPDADRGDD